MNSIKIAFVGAGNMATALIKGLISHDTAPLDIWAADPDKHRLSELQQQCGINVTDSNTELVTRADVILLAVKPQLLRQVTEKISPALKQKSCLLISIAAGIPLRSIEQWTHVNQPLVRCMPNTPALVHTGASGLFANNAVTAAQKETAEAILSAVGTVCWLQSEQDMDTVTALSGSGPAYFFLLMEAMQEAAEKMGLDAETARSLCTQTALGAARLADGSSLPVDQLRQQVTSPGGTTEAALQQFADEQMKAIVERAMFRAAERSRELARQS